MCHRLSLWIPGIHLLVQTSEDVEGQSRTVDVSYPSVKQLVAQRSLAVGCLYEQWFVQSQWTNKIKRTSNRNPSVYNWYRISILAVKRPGHGADHPLSRAEITERIEPQFYSPSRTSWSVLRRPLSLRFLTRRFSNISSSIRATFTSVLDIRRRPVRTSLCGSVCYAGTGCANFWHTVFSQRHYCTHLPADRELEWM